jgi:RNA polymerase sigma-54 factor
MALTQRLEIRQGQSLVMTPLLQQSIKLLQLSNIELAAFVQAELEKNPLLERDGGGEEETHASEPQDGAFETPADGAAAQNETDDSPFADEPRDDSSDAPQFATSHSGSSTGESGELDIEILPDQKPTLRAHLEAQLALAALPAARRFIAEVLIDAVDEAGYLRADLAEVAGRLGISTDECESVLAVLQGFEPCGVFARSLVECLALQLRERQRLDPAMELMLSRLDLVAKRDCTALCALCGLDMPDIVEMIAEIRALDPKPGLAFGIDHVETIIPDILVRRSASGWQIELNPDALPRVLVNSVYYAEVNRKALARHEKTFLSECLNTANWLTRSLDQRAKTILKVAREIVRRQDAFLTDGVRHLRPLNLKAVADSIGMHESTVSRVTSNKYIDTPRGMFELKFFFTSAIQAVDGGEAHSATAVKDRIRELVANEQNDVLSDDRIVTILTADGIEIARRTVAKYREELRIRSSVERRRLRQAQTSAPAVQSC